MADINMSNDDIIAEFDDLFADSSTDDGAGEGNPGTDDNQNDDDQNDDDQAGNDDSNQGDGEGTDGNSDDGDGNNQDDNKDNPPEDKAAKAQAQQNYRFAEMRTQLKAQETMLKNLGKAIGLDPNASAEEVADKVNEVLLKKQSKETGIPEDVLQRLQVLEARDANYQHAERQTKTQNAITDLIEKYNLDQESVDGFVQQLIQSGRNPMEVDGVDIEAEYIKHNFQSILDSKIDKAVNAERERIKKAANQSSSGVGSKPNEGGSDKKINSVKDLDDFFNSVEL